MKRGSRIAGEMGGTALSVSPYIRSRRRELLSAFPAAGLPTVKSLRNIGADGRVRVRGRRIGMDITWVTDQIAVGGGIWHAENMAVVAQAGIKHIINMQIEFDGDTRLAEPFGIVVCWNPVDDDFEPKPAKDFERGVGFALKALKEPDTKLFIHCAAGVHRAPMMALAVLGVMERAKGKTVEQALEDSMNLIQTKRLAADFAEVYVESVEEFLCGRG